MTRSVSCTALYTILAIAAICFLYFARCYHRLVACTPSTVKDPAPLVIREDPYNPIEEKWVPSKEKALQNQLSWENELEMEQKLTDKEFLIERPYESIRQGQWFPNQNLDINVRYQNPNAFVERQIRKNAHDPYSRGLQDTRVRSLACPITIYTLGFRGYPVAPFQKMASQNDDMYYWEEPLLSSYQDFDVVRKPN